MAAIHSTEMSPAADLFARVLTLAERYVDRRGATIDVEATADDLARDAVRLIGERGGVIHVGALPAFVKLVVSLRLRQWSGKKHYGARIRRLHDSSDSRHGHERMTHGWTVDTAELNALHDEALDRLCQTSRRAYLMVCVDGVSVDACSLLLGMTEQAVRGNVRTARRGLHAAMLELGVITLRDVVPSARYHAERAAEPDGVNDSPDAPAEHSRSAA